MELVCPERRFVLELVYPRSDEKRLVHLSELVELATEDLENDREVLPRDLYIELVETQEQFLGSYKWLSKKNGEKMVAVAQRNKTHKRLSYFVLDVFVMARRKYDRGDLSAEAMNLHCIPRGTVYERGRPEIWSTHTKQLLEGDAVWSQNNRTLLTDPTRDMLIAANTAAKQARNAANRAISELSKAQTQMQGLRKKVAELLGKARLFLMGAFYHLDPPKLRELLFAYGYRFRSSRNKAKSEVSVIPKAPAVAQPAPVDHAFNYDPNTSKRSTKAEQKLGEISENQEPQALTPPETQGQDVAAEAPQTQPEPTTHSQDSARPLEPKAFSPQQKVTDPSLLEAITLEAPELQQTQTSKTKDPWADVRKQAEKRKAAMAQNPKQRKKRPSKSKKHK